MNLHTATIRTTGLMLIATIIVPNACVLVTEGRPTNCSTTSAAIRGILYDMFMLWLFSGSPMLVSFALAMKLKHGIPTLILLVATIAYGILFVYSQYMYLAGPRGCMQTFWLVTPLASLYWMLPSWIAAWLLNSRYVNNNSEPETATSASSSPAP